MFKLYYTPATCSLAAHIALREANAEFQLKRVSFTGRPGFQKEAVDEDGGDFYLINPRGYVPALELPDRTVLTEVPAILMFIAQETQKDPSGPDKFRLLEMISIIAFELQAPVGTLLLQDLPDTERERLAQKVHLRLTWIQDQIRSEGFLFGDQFSAADALLYTILNWLSMAKIDLNAWQGLKDFRKRVASRPSVDAALKAEGLRKA